MGQITKSWPPNGGSLWWSMTMMAPVASKSAAVAEPEEEAD